MSLNPFARSSLTIALALILATACSADEGAAPIGTTTSSIAESVDPDLGRTGPEVRNYIFGHSLIVHAEPLEPAEPDETTIPHWLGLLAETDANSYRVDGQYGFLRSHAELDPQPQWGFANVAGVWDVDSGMSFGDADFTHVLLTPANFIQGQAADAPFEDDPSGPSPLSTTLEIIDKVVAAEPGVEILIYENWPDLAAFSQFPPDERALAAYHEYTATGFHEWWIAYVDALQSARPDVAIELVPVGSTIARLLSTSPWDQIPVIELYEDDAPHGRPTIYFLAALITYSHLFGSEPPTSFEAPPSVHPLIRDDLATVITQLR